MIPSSSTVNSVRRYYLFERLRARAELSPTEPAWQYKQEAMPGTPLPADFPFRAALVLIGYTTYADLFGADENELRTNVGLSPFQAEIVLGLLEDEGNPDAVLDNVCRSVPTE